MISLKIKEKVASSGNLFYCMLISCRCMSLEKKIKLLLISFFLLLVSAPAIAGNVENIHEDLPVAYTYDFNEQCRKAYESVIKLKLDEAAKILAAERKLNPGNLIPVYLENYIDFFELFFNEDPVQFKRKIAHYDQRMQLLSKGPHHSPYYLLTRSVVHLQWAFVQIKFGRHWDGGWSFRRSFLQSKENVQRFPSFQPSVMYMGAMETAAGSIPDGYKWLSGLLGIKGTIEGGMKRLEDFIEAKDPFSELYENEAIFYYLYLRNYVMNDRKGVFDFLNKNKLDLVNNHLFAYMAANLSINNQRSSNARSIIEAISDSPGYLETPVWDLEMGYAKLYMLDPGAGLHFERFLKNFKGRFYVKDALQKLSWHYYLQGNMSMAQRYRQMIHAKGTLDTEADKQANKEAHTNSWPNILLLKARLLNDGGNNREALALLHGKTIDDFATSQDKLEFAYRAARLFDDLGNDSQAITFYKMAIVLGEKGTEYFAARSALQIGYIFENRKQCAAASTWFKKCMSMKGHDYKNSLDQKAKAGLLRCR